MSFKSGTRRFIAQRVTAVLLLPLVAWALCFFEQALIADDSIINLLAKTPSNVVLSSLFVTVFLYHGYLGMQVICEDYIHSKALLSASLIILQAICLVTFFTYNMMWMFR